ncbi:MAG: LysE family transporter [Flavobacterium sp.]|nr:LysE family transporter [Candidatus Neoflavobacterium equi]
MLDDILTGIPLGFFLSFMIGPVFFVLLETSITKGIKAALTFDFGVILADMFFICVAYFSSYKLLESIKDDPAIFIFGGLIMFGYGIISFFKLKKENVNIKETSEIKEVLGAKNYLALFIKGFLLNFINIGVLGFWLGILLTFGPQFDMQTSRLLLFFVSVIGAYFVTDIGKIILAKQLRSKLTPKNILKVKKISSIVLIVFGLALMSQGLFPKEKEMLQKQLEKVSK